MKRAVWAKKGLRQLGSETQPGITCHALGPWSLCSHPNTSRVLSTSPEGWLWVFTLVIWRGHVPHPLDCGLKGLLPPRSPLGLSCYLTLGSKSTTDT